MKINLLPKKTWKQSLWKTINVVSSISLIFNMSMLGVFVTPKAAGAVTPWPTDSQWVIPICNDDPAGDESPSSVDLKATGSQYGAAYFADANNLYVRERVDGNPGSPGNWDQFAWVLMIQKNVATTDYDYLISLRGSGQGENVELWENTTKDGPIDWSPIFNDPAETLLNSWETTTHSRVTSVGADDYYIDWQIPLSELDSRGVNLLNSGLYFATSADANNYNKDHLDCYNAPVLDISKFIQKNHTGDWFEDGRIAGIQAEPGDTLTYRVKFTNAGGPKMNSTSIIDELGKGDAADGNNNIDPATQYSDWMSVLNLDSDGNTNAYTGSWGNGSADGQANDTLSASIPYISGGGASEQLTFDAVVRNDLAVGTYLDENTTTLMSDAGAPLATDETDIQIVKVGQCDLRITKSVNKTTAVPGETLTYTINYSNPGTANCTGGGVQIFDALNSHLTYNGTHTENVTGDTDGQGITYEGNFNGTDLVANVHVVSPGEAGTITFGATLDNNFECGHTDIPNKAKIWSNETGDIWSNEVHTDVYKACYGSLKVTKVVDSGSATPDQWSFTTNAQTLTPTSGQNYVIFTNLLGGNYTVTESALAGYHQVSTTCNNVNVIADQQATCEFHNARDTGTITVNKKVDANGDGTFEGGNTEANALGFKWGLDGNTNNRDMGSSATSITTGNHTINENSVSNYHFVGWYPTSSTEHNCNNPESNTLPASIDVTKDATTSITLCNAHDKGNLKINKAVDTNGDGQIEENNPAGWTWDLDAGNQNYAMGSTQSVITGNHNVTEDQHTNFSATGWTCDNGTSGSGESLSVNVTTAGVTCTFTNARDTGQLTVVKHVVGGTAVAGDWTMHIDTLYSFPGNEAGVTKTLITGDYQVTESNGPADYTLAYSGDCDSNGHVTINKGDNKTCTLTNTRDKGWLKVVKHVVNDNGGNDSAADFSLHVKQGGVDVSGSPAAGSETGTLYNLETGAYIVSENSHAGYTQTGIVCDSQNTDTANVTKTNSSTNPVVCTITNDDIAPTITLIKNVTNNNGGTAGVNDFGLTIGGTAVNSGDTLNVNANTPIALNEAGKAGYNFVSITGDAKCPSVLNGTVTLNEGENVTCTINNDDIAPKLKLIKTVTNDNGGTKQVADFPLFINGSPVTSGNWNEVVANVEYTATETSDPDYAASTWSGDCTADGKITLQPGNEKICYITNNDIQPKLTVTKVVINNNGGIKVIADFPLFVNSTPVVSGVQNGFNAGAYVVSETNQTGYTATISGDCDVNGNVSLSVGDVKSCIITNDDEAPTITLNKVVNNNHGGNAGVNNFGLTIGGTGVTSGQTLAVDSNTPIALNEAGLTGYNFVSLTGNAKCPQLLGGTVTLGEGEDITCTITNEDIAPTITLIKSVTNDNGGNAGVNDFGLTIGATGVNSSQTLDVMANTPYALNEAGLTGYTFVSLTGDAKCPSVLGGTVTLDEGEDITCTITNDDQAPTITLNKVVNNNHGGNAGINDFGLTIGATGATSGQTLAVNSNTPIALNEAGLTGYTFVSLTGNAKCPSVLGGTVTLDEDEDITCTITNEDIAPTITLNKVVNNNHGGNAGINDFGLTIGATGVTSGQTLDVNSNTPIALNEAGLTGYNFVSLTGDEECPDVLGGTVTLDEGEDITCTITNEDIAPTITLIKNVSNNNGGNAGENDFGLTIGATSVNSSQTLNVNANTPIALNEDGLAGYSFISLTGDAKCPQLLGGTVTLDEGEDITCTITNDDIVPRLIIIKHVVNDNGGTASASDFTINVSGNNPSPSSFDGVDDPGTQVYLNAGSYNVTEDGLAEYAATFSADCTGSISIGGYKECTITNDDIPGKITGYKYDNEDNPLNGWEICLSGGAIQDGIDIDFGFTSFSIPLSNCVITGAGEWPDGYYEFINLNAGLYTLTETVQPGWAPVDPVTGQYTDVPVLIGQETQRDFYNRRIYPDLTITKDDGKTTANAGENLIYTLVITNNGEYKAEGITVVDTLPAHLTYVSDTSGVAVNQVGNVLTWDFPSAVLDVSQTMTFTVTVKIDDVMPFGTTTLRNVILVATDSYEPNTSNNSAFDNTDVSAAPVLGLTKTAPAQVNAGDNITYTINWSVNGNSQATQVVLWDPIPTNTTFVSADNSGVYDAATKTVTWTLGTKNPGDAGTVHMVVKTNSPLADGTIITNTANLDSAETDPAVQATAQTKIVSGPILNITKSDTPDPVKPADNINYTINWSITGNATAHNVKITDGIPTNTTYVSVADGGVYNVNTNTITWTLGTKNPGDSGSVHFVVKVNTPLTNGTVIKNTATIDCDETPPTSADANTTVVAAPILKITKSVDQSFVNPGGTANYTVVIENTGNDTAINVKLNDLLPSGFTFTDYGTNTHTFSLGNLAAGAKISITYNVTIGTGVAAGTYENLAVAWADNHSNVTAKVPLEVRVPKVLAEEPKPELTIDKTVDKSIANPGNVITYTVKVTNNGDATAINVQLQDVLPAGFTFEGSDNISKTWDLGDILVGETKQVTYSVKIDDKILAGTYENLAVAWADNNDQVTDFATVEVKVIKVLAETGPGAIDFLYFFGAGTVLLTSLYVLGLTRRREEK